MGRSWVYFEGRAAGTADGLGALCDREESKMAEQQTDGSVQEEQSGLG